MMEARLDLSLHIRFRIDLFVPSSRTTSPNKKKDLPKSPRPRPPPLDLLGFVRIISKDVILQPSLPQTEAVRGRGAVGVLVAMETVMGRVVRKTGVGGQCVGGRKES